MRVCRCVSVHVRVQLIPFRHPRFFVVLVADTFGPKAGARTSKMAMAERSRARLDIIWTCGRHQRDDCRRTTHGETWASVSERDSANKRLPDDTYTLE